MNKKIRVGLIGTGKHGSRYASHLLNDLQDRFRLIAISRRSAKGRKQAEEWGATHYQDWAGLIADAEVDAVIAATPPHINPEILDCCALHNKPLLIEKPLTTDYAAAVKAVKKFSDKSLPLTVGHTLRYNSVILGLREQYKSMGRLYSFSATQRLEPSSHPWLEDPEVAGGGVIFHTAIHMFDAIRFITGEAIVGIKATAKKIHNPNLEDLLTAQLELSNGAIGLVDTSKVGPARSGRYEFVCEKGQLQGDQVHGQLQKIEGMKIVELPIEPLGPAILPLLKDWHLFLSGDGKNPISADAGLAAVKVCDACRTATKTDMRNPLDGLK